jgi:hypothetical protein
MAMTTSEATTRHPWSRWHIEYDGMTTSTSTHHSKHHQHNIITTRGEAS